jgi:hypothetical protein
MELQGQPGGTSNHIDGDILGAAVQAHSITGGVHIHVTSPTEPAAQPAIGRPPSWEERPELPPEIRSLLSTQIRAAEKFPYRLRGARTPSLATVYVRQDLSSGAAEPTSEQPPQPIPMLDGRGQLTEVAAPPVIRPTVRPPSRTVRDALDSDDHVLITGGPGQGKSTLSLRLAADIAGKWTSTDSEATPLTELVVPLRLTARELATRLDLPFPQALSDCLGAEYGARLACPVSAHVLAERVAGCRWLLLVDGLDEVADVKQRDELVDVLANWTSDPTESPYRAVVTTRPLGGAALAPLQGAGASRYELQPFDEEALRRFAHNWFKNEGDQADVFLRQIREAHLDELARVPLLATIAAIVFEQHDDRPLPGNRYELYEAYLKYLRSGPGRPFDHWCDPLLEHLGRVRLEADTSLVAAAHDWAAEHIPQAELDDEWREQLIVYLAAVGPLTRRGDDLAFIHHSFAEHLAATAKARLLPVTFAHEHPDFVRLLHAARPKERGRHARLVLLHYARLHPAEADRMIRWLRGGDSNQHLLAARLLAWQLPAGLDAMDAFLATVRAWAMTTQYPAAEILSETSRAAHYPGLAEWLLDLMNDEDAPWASRVEAATALATRLRGAGTATATAMLHGVVTDESVPVRHRLEAAEALSQRGIDERAAAERGLVAVLADPSADGGHCRTAAVVLAGLGAEARTYAVRALLRLLDDPDTPGDDLLEAATALVEIGADCHERCVAVFRAILTKRRTGVSGVRDAAIGLASLGPKHLADAVTALTQMISDRRSRSYVRTTAARTLAELGPQHRTAAGELLVALTANHGMPPAERSAIATTLVDIGPEFHEQAAGIARGVFADRSANPNNILWAARVLVDLGPDGHAEAARELNRVAVHPLADQYTRTSSLRQLAELGEPHRAPAIASLRSIMADRDEDLAVRCEAAEELAGLGPEHHPEVAEHLLDIATNTATPDVRVNAWRQLRYLGARFGGRASRALAELMGPVGAQSWESHGELPFFEWMDAPVSQAAVALKAVFDDPTWSTRIRAAAIRNLVHFGRRHHRGAVERFVELLRADAVPDNELIASVGAFSEVSAGLRADVYGAVRTIAMDADAPADRILDAASALEELTGQVDPEVVTVLEGTAADGTVDASTRAKIALISARSAPSPTAVVADLVLRFCRDMPFALERCVRDLVGLGVDVAPAMSVLVSDPDATRWTREAAALILVKLCPGLRDEGLAELRTQAADEFLEFPGRGELVRQLATLEPDTADDAIAYHRSVLESEHEPISHRCRAAAVLVRLDQSTANLALGMLRQLARNTELTLDERNDAIGWLDYLNPRASETVPLRLAIVNDPTASSTLRGQLATELPGKQARAIRRLLLADHTADLDDRLSEVGEWRDRPLTAKAAALARDIIAGAETSPAERVEAAAALVNLSPETREEGRALLVELAQDPRCGPDARLELAKLSRSWRDRVVADARRELADESQSHRDRDAACQLVLNLTSEPRDAELDYLRQQLRDKRISDYDRLHIMRRLRQFDGIRAIRDDEQAEPAIRWTAATLLLNYGVPDRAAGARVLNTIATNSACRPALRWRAANDLTRFGARGREWGVATLQVIMADDAMPVIVRIIAARALGQVRPDLRTQVLRLLRSLSTVERPAERLQVLAAIGLFDPVEGAFALRAMSEEAALPPTVRLRCAVAMTEMHRDLRDGAAGVAYEIAFDDAIAWHVRAKAARVLAKLSTPCRAQARQLLAELNSWQQPSRPS